MADHDNQGFFRAAQPRTPMKVNPPNDPLAELARLIGQTDPFAEFGHKPQQQNPAHATQDWGAQAPGYASQAYEQQAQAGVDPFRSQYEQDQHAAGYESDPYLSDAANHETDLAYDDVPPPRRRLSVIAIAAVSAIAVVGTAGAFGYRSLFGSSGNSPPPIIKPDPAPTKVVPPSKVDAQSNKLIYDRVGERSSGEKIVSREEQPIDISKPTQANLFPNAIDAGSTTPAGSVGASAMDQPKKVHTIAIRPDQPLGTNEPPAASSRTAAAKPAPAPVPAAKPLAPVKPAAPQRLASAPPVATADAEEAAPVARAAPVRPAAPPRQANGPLSLSPDASPPARAEPTRTATAPAPRSVPAPAVSGGAGQYAVQVSSQRSEAEAEAAFRSLQGKYPGQLGGKPHVVRRADLGEKGTYYRALVGPFTSAGEANELCQSLKSAGGSCLIQRN
jgi:hypothetical protein